MLHRFVLLILCAVGLGAQSTLALKTFQRIDLEDGTSKVILIHENPKAKLNYAADRRGYPLYGRLWLPYPPTREERSKGQNSKEEKVFELRDIYLCPLAGRDCTTLLDAEGEKIGSPWIEAILPKAAVEALENYAFSTQEELLEDGRRYEALLELKNLDVDGLNYTASAFVPSTPTLVYDAVSDFTEGRITFRAAYVPVEVRSYFLNQANWKLNSKEVCCVESGPGDFWLTFCSANVTIAAQNSSMKLEFSEDPKPAAPEPGAEKRVQLSPAQVTRGGKYAEVLRKGRATFTRRPQPVRFYGRALRFRTDAVTASRDLPIYIKFNYAYSGTDDTRHAYMIESAFNLDEKLGVPAQVVSPVGNLHMAPSLFVKMNANSFIDDENTFQWGLPIEWRWDKHPFCKDGKTCAERFRPRALRQVTFGAGLRGEHSRGGQSQNLVVPIGFDFKFAKKRKSKWAMQFDQRFGVVTGRNLTGQLNAFTLADTGKKLLNPVNVTNDVILRTVGVSKFSWSFGDQASLRVDYRGSYLHREEQYIDVVKVKGAFRAGDDKPKDFPVEALAASQSLFVPKYRDGGRQHVNVDFSYELTPAIDLSLTYARGAMEPSWQYVNKFTVGIAFKFLGKLKQ